MNGSEKRGIERGRTPQSSVKKQERAIMSQMNIQTVSKTTLEKHLRHGVYIGAFSRA